ncbi:MAG: VOC family protein [Thermorudis peleae]|nr:VOC family protein [Thermorudis peleae]
MLTQIDHIVVLVTELQQAITTFHDAGFHVIIGGEHPGGTHNALVIFRDGAYLELLAFHHPERRHVHRWYRFLALGGGLIDFCLASDNLDGERARLRMHGLPYRGPEDGSRLRPDGEKVAWRLLVPIEDLTGALPFMIQDVTPREVRVPPTAAQHQNGVTGIGALIVAVPSLDEAVPQYEAILDRPVEGRGEDMELVAETALFTLGPHQLILAAPLGPHSPLASQVIVRPGPAALILQSTTVSGPTPLALNGLRLTLVPTTS